MKIKTPVNQAEIRLMKSQGHSDSTIANVTGLTMGAVQRMLQSSSVFAMRHCRKDQRTGHFRPNPFGEPSTAQPAVKKLAKSSIPNDEPAVITEAREMLSLGIDADKVAKQLGITREFMHKWLGPTWQI
jgi:predicted transcriptional regulator